MPLEIVSEPPAYTNLDASTGPKHGVHPAAKAIPMSTELYHLVIFFGVFTLPLNLAKSNLINPVIFNPKSIISTPLIFATTSLFLMNIFPKKLAEVPIIINIIVNPNTNPNVLVNANSLLSCTSLSKVEPVIYIIYPGIIGNIQGVKNDRNPAPNAIGRETSLNNIASNPLSNN